MKTDILVVGSGIAGLSFALKASKIAKVTILTKDKLEESNTKYAQGGLAAVLSKDDATDLHIKDTLRAGDGLCNKKAAEILAKEAPIEIAWLTNQGIKFDKQISKEAVHSRARIAHIGDLTGKEVEKALAEKARKNKNITILENTQLIDLIKDKNKVMGATTLNTKSHSINKLLAKATILATGGIGQLFKQTCNPEIATGDGIAAAYRAGASLTDMEFVQFHPTGLYNTSFLISETLRGEGGILTNKKGKRFMPYYHRDGDLAPRDVVSKFSVVEMKKTRTDHVYLDVRQLGEDYIKKRFPNITRICKKHRIDITRQKIPVSPTAHYLCGGIKTDLDAKTTINNLYALGECSGSGLHGADRLASNSLTDGLVFGTRLVNHLKKSMKKEKTNPKDKTKKTTNKINKTHDQKSKKLSKSEKKQISTLKSKIKDIMWKKVGIIRTKKGISTSINKLKLIEKKAEKIRQGKICKETIELYNLAQNALIIAKSALSRKESRGTHFIVEYPERNDKTWQKHSEIKKGLILKFFK